MSSRPSRTSADDDFTVTVHRAGPLHTLHGRGWLTPAGGELLCTAIVTIGRQPGDRLVADLSALTGVDAAGWAWLLPALQHCQAAGCELSVVAPMTCAISGEPDAPESVDPPAAQLRCYPDGPLLLRGDAELLGRDGTPLPRTGSALALCRCGASSIKPFCDGSHKAIGFTDR